MKRRIFLCLALVLSGGLFGCATAARHRADVQSPKVVKLRDRSFVSTRVDKNLTQQISDILKECESVKPSMTRADLLKVFTIEGGLSTQIWRTYVHSRCPYIKVDVEFAPTKSGQEQPTDIITKISKPYLAWSIID